MNIKTEFTKPECDRFREKCNFLEDELAIFDLRVKGKQVVEIQMELQKKNMNMSQSTIERRLRNIKKKISKVIRESDDGKGTES